MDSVLSSVQRPVKLIMRNVLLIAICVCGCSGPSNPPVIPGVVVQGKILKGGQPLSVPNQDIGVGVVEVMLIPLNENPNSELQTTNAKSDGTFEIIGAGKGIPPGAYKVAVFQRDQGIESDQLQGDFSKEKTPIQIDVPEAKTGQTLRLEPIELESYLKK